MTDLTIRAAVPEDGPALVRLIHGLAAYEQQSESCMIDEAALRAGLFGPRPYAEAIVAEQAGQVLGYALFFGYFSPYPGVPSIFLEHLYVVPEQRGRGTGRALLRRVAQIAVERGAGRLEWGVHRENGPAIGFYRALGATIVGGMLACRLDGDTLRRVAGEG